MSALASLLAGEATAQKFKDSDGGAAYTVPGCVEKFPQALCGGEPTVDLDKCEGNTLTEQFAFNN